MTLTYCHILQRAFDKYTVLDRPVLVTKRYTVEDKVSHLTAFMRECKSKQIIFPEYEAANSMSVGSLSTFTRWLMEGRLGECSEELTAYYTERYLSNRKRSRRASCDTSPS